MAGSLNERQLKLVNFMEQTFWTQGALPSYEFVAEELKESESYVKTTMKHPVVRKALMARGVDLRPNDDARLLTSEQLMAANLVLNPHDVRSEREKLDFLGISSQKWAGWLRQPGFSQYMTKRAENMFSANDFAAYKALQSNVEEGDLNAVKFHFEMRGKYKNTVDVNINVEQVVLRVVEIVAKHISDPDILMAIATDIEALEGVKEKDESEMLTLPSGVLEGAMT